MFNNFTETELTNEQWKDIAGYEGVYQVSDLGRVRSLKYGKVRVLKSNENSAGYLTIHLYRSKKKKTVKVHRLVAQAFIKNDTETKTLINHKNEVKTDNRAVNLEWCTASYNLRYNDLNLRRKNCKRRKLKSLYDPKLSIDDNLNVFKENGVECCRQTLWKLRKDLGIINRQ